MKFDESKLIETIDKKVENNSLKETIRKVVTEIIKMKDGTYSSINDLLKEDIGKFTSEELFDIDKFVNEICLQFKIKLDRSEYENKIVGLPYNIPFKKIEERLKCPICGETLMLLMPSGTKLYCKKCNKYYINDNGSVGKEIVTPYNKDDALY